MQITFSKKQLAEYFPELEQKAINSVWLALNIISDLDKEYWDTWAAKKLPHYMHSRSTKRIDGVLHYANEKLECHGVEALNKPGYIHSPYWQDIVALYLNSGDCYSATLIFDIEEGALHLSTYADWLERNTIKEFEEV